MTQNEHDALQQQRRRTAATRRDVRDAFADLIETWHRVGVTQPSYDGSRTLTADDLTILPGSKANGVDYRLVYRHPITGGLEPIDGMSGGRLGLTPTEAHASLSALDAGLRIAQRARVHR